MRKKTTLLWNEKSECKCRMTVIQWCEHLLLLSASKLQSCLCSYQYLVNMISLLCKGWGFVLYNIRRNPTFRIQPCIQLVQALVIISRLDYCNVFLCQPSCIHISVVWLVFNKTKRVLTPLVANCCLCQVQSVIESTAPCGTHTKGTKPLSQNFTFTVRQRWNDLSISTWALEWQQLINLLFLTKTTFLLFSYSQLFHI